MQRADVTSVVVADGVVVAYPTISVTAPSAGSVKVAVTAGTLLKAGDLVATVGTTAVRAPAAATVDRVDLPAGSTDVVPNAPLVTLRYAGFGISVTLDPQQAYRADRPPVAARASLRFGAAAFTCQLVNVPPDGSASTGAPSADGGSAAGGSAVGGSAVGGSSEPTSQPAGGGLVQGPGSGDPAGVCLVPAQIRAHEGQQAQVGLQYGSAQGALVLPVSAVAGSAQTGQVRRRQADGSFATVSVALGITDGSVVQILSGLSLGDVVSASPPELGSP